MTQSAARSARDVLHQSIELAVAAEELARRSVLRVQHFAQQLASPFPFLRRSVPDESHRNRYGRHRQFDTKTRSHVEDAGATDLISTGTAPARNQPRLAGAGHRRLASLRLQTAGRWNRRGHGSAPCRMFSSFERRRLRSTRIPRTMFPNPPGLLRPSASEGLR